MMKKTFLFIPTLLIIVSTAIGQSFNNYGEKISPNITHAYSSVKASIQNESMDDVILEGEIVQTCPKKGCWVRMKVSESDTLMVRFKDYGFFVPKEGMEKKKVIVKKWTPLQIYFQPIVFINVSTKEWHFLINSQHNIVKDFVEGWEDLILMEIANRLMPSIKDIEKQL